MDTTVQIALIAMISAVGAFASPIVMAAITNRNLRRSKQDDYERQDMVAARAQAVAQKAADDAHTAANLLLAANEKLDAATSQTNVKLDVIHTLVNSEKTAAMQGQVDILRMHLVSLKEIIALKQAQNIDPSVESRAEIEVVEAKIIETQKVVTERLAADKAATIVARES